MCVITHPRRQAPALRLGSACRRIARFAAGRTKDDLLRNNLLEVDGHCFSAVPTAEGLRILDEHGDIYDAAGRPRRGTAEFWEALGLPAAA